SFTPTKPLLIHRDSSWKGVALDGKGAEVSSQSFSFEIRYLNDAIQATANAAFAPRTAAAAVACSETWCAIGGTAPGEPIQNDAGNRMDGETWVEVTHNAACSSRYYHSVLAYDDKLWVIGGYAGHNPEKDAWFSSDGTTWTEVPNANFGPRYGHTS